MAERGIASETREGNQHEQRSEENPEQHIGRGWHGDSEGHAAAGRKGGQTVAQNRDHMAAIGRKGGQAVSRDRRHMAEIGRRGGQARGKNSAQSTGNKSGNNRQNA